MSQTTNRAFNSVHGKSCCVRNKKQSPHMLITINKNIMEESLKEDFESMTRLYHFTRFETALLIVKSGKLRFSKLFAMNDICESNKQIYNNMSSCNQGWFTNEISKEISRYRQISMTMDKEGKLGFDLTQMWGHYANNGYGVCLAFDKTAIERICKSKSIKYGEVLYDEETSPCTRTDVQNKKEIIEYVRNNADSLFFHKRKEWESEQEFRYIKRCAKTKDCFLDIKKALKYVIMCNSQSQSSEDSITGSTEYAIMKDVLRTGNIPILQYTYFLDNCQLVCEDSLVWSSDE